MRLGAAQGDAERAHAQAAALSVQLASAESRAAALDQLASDTGVVLSRTQAALEEAEGAPREDGGGAPALPYRPPPPPRCHPQPSATLRRPASSPSAATWRRCVRA